MHQLKAVRAQALTTREMAQIGLFTALIAAGAFIKINIPVQPFPMHFTLQFLFVLLAGFILGAKRGAICVGIYLAVGLSGICGRRRTGLFDPAYIRLFTWLCVCRLDHRENISDPSGSWYSMGSVFRILGNDGILCIRNGVFLCDQQLCDPYAGFMEAGSDQLFSYYCFGRFSSLRSGSAFSKEDPRTGGRYVPKLVYCITHISHNDLPEFPSAESE